MKLALGTVQMGKEYGIQKNGMPGIHESIELLADAVKMGVKVLDTAAAYGNAECIIGEFINCGYIKRSTVSVITKLAPGVLDDVPINDYTPALENAVEKSLCRLRTDYLDGLLFHDARYVFNAGAIDALIRIKRPGYINRVGISVYTPDEAMKGLTYGIDIIQVPYNILDRRLDKIGFFEKAKKCGITVFARSPLLQGLLVMAPDQIPAYMQYSALYVKEYREMCSELQMTPVECAIMFASSHQYIDYLLFGIDNAKQLREVVSAFKKKMDAAAIENIRNKFLNVPERIIMPNLWPSGV